MQGIALRADCTELDLVPCVRLIQNTAALEPKVKTISGFHRDASSEAALGSLGPDPRACSYLFGIDVGREHRHVSEVAVVLGVVQAIAHDKLDGDIEADIGHVDLDLQCLGLAQHCADTYGACAAALKVFLQP